MQSRVVDAGAVGPENGDDLPFGNVQADPVQDLDIAVAYMQVVNG